MIRTTLLLGLLLPSLLTAAPLPVSVTVLPLQTMVEKIGGDLVSVSAMVQPGDDPHTYSPSPQQITRLVHSRLYLRAGLPFEEIWMERIHSANPEMVIVDLRQGEAHEPEHEPEDEHQEEVHHAGDHAEDHEVGHEHEIDPHLWTNPLLAMEMAEVITSSLVALDPGHQQQYLRNHALFRQQLAELDREIRLQLQPLKKRKFMVFHPAWGHFAEQYGLIQVAIEHEGKDPGAQTLASLIRRARQERVRAIFVQPQFSQRAAQQIAAAIQGEVIFIDPLSADYIENLRRVSSQLAKALQP